MEKACCSLRTWVNNRYTVLIWAASGKIFFSTADSARLGASWQMVQHHGQSKSSEKGRFLLAGQVANFLGELGEWPWPRTILGIQEWMLWKPSEMSSSPGFVGRMVHLALQGRKILLKIDNLLLVCYILPSMLLPTLTVSGKEDYNIFYLCLWNLGHLGSLWYKLYVYKLHNYIVHVFCFNPW